MRTPRKALLRRKAGARREVPTTDVVLAASGDIVSAEDGWEAVSPVGGKIGENYVSLCEAADSALTPEAGLVADGVRRILNGQLDSFTTEYSTDAGRRWIRIVAGPDLEAAGGAIVRHLDVTDLIGPKAHLPLVNENFRILVENSLQGILVHRYDELLYVNQALADLLGYDDPEEVMALGSVEAWVPPDERNRIRDFAKRRMQGEAAPNKYESPAIKKNGEMIWVEARGVVVDWQGEPAILGMASDVTNIRLARERLESLIEAGVAFDEPFKDMDEYQTPLSHAVESDHLQLVQHLLSAGADPNRQASEDEEMSVLALACRAGKTEIVKVLLAAGADPNLSVNDGATALYTAAQMGHTEIVRMLISKGADPNNLCSGGSYPLAAAISGQMAETAGALIEAGAKPDIDGASGQSLLHIVAASKDVTELSLEPDTVLGGIPIMKARHRTANAALCRMLMEAGADPEALHDGRSVLESAIEADNADVADFLLENGVDLMRQTEDGMTMLQLAIAGGKIGVVHAMLAEGADLGPQGASATTIADWAGDRGNETVNRLVQFMCGLHNA